MFDALDGDDNEDIDLVKFLKRNEWFQQNFDELAHPKVRLVHPKQPEPDPLGETLGRMLFQ